MLAEIAREFLETATERVVTMSLTIEAYDRRLAALARIAADPEFVTETTDHEAIIERAVAAGFTEGGDSWAKDSETAKFLAHWGDLVRTVARRKADEAIRVLQLDRRHLFENIFYTRVEEPGIRHTDSDRRYDIWGKLQQHAVFWRDDAFGDASAQHFNILNTITDQVRQKTPGTSVVDQGGDRGFFVAINLAAKRRAVYFRGLASACFSQNLLTHDGIYKLLGFLNKAVQGDFTDTVFNRAVETVSGDFKNPDADHLDRQRIRNVIAEQWRFSAPAESVSHFANQVLGSDRRQQRGPSLVMQFRAAVQAEIDESRRAYENTRRPTLQKGVEALLKAFLGNDRTMLKDATLADIECAVDNTIDVHGWRWRSRPDRSGREQAVTILWDALSKLRDQNKGWSQHRHRM
ncbi:MAG: hypothetical protein H6865_07200 [Rhodospirillales bacterium]|nr:hypothetical protein [Alphaproteobacteria bacterium]MCB9987404.1 hypothetical protein [Rhodospirillales bacterium]USO07614.1 MAG: hypothetical protein H6866_09455 [Rhodospirillales bacterium]